MTDEITNDAVDMADSATPETGDTKPKRKGRPSKTEQSEELDGKATTTVECTKNSTTDENITTPKVTRVKGVKRIQVSAYLPYETYEIMKILSSATNESIGDTLASFAIEYATKNRETAESLKKVLQGMKVKRPKIE